LNNSKTQKTKSQGDYACESQTARYLVSSVKSFGVIIIIWLESNGNEMEKEYVICLEYTA
jgi:hypothetical protein